jgi:CubicO group peptidase (beta-lactamase class C family)
MLSTSASIEPSPSSDTWADQDILDYVALLNTGDRGALRDYTAHHTDPTLLGRLPIDIAVNLQLAVYYASVGRGCEVYDSQRPQSHEVSIRLRNRLTETWARLRIPISAEPPYRINGVIRLEHTEPPAGALPVPGLSDSEIVGRLQECLGKMDEDDEFSGAIVVAKDGVPLLQHACGLASKSYMVGNRPDTKFNIASAGKMFTGIAVAQLAEQGRLSFEDSLNRFLPPDWLESEVSREIQIRHLLTHTSGLGDYFGLLNASSGNTLYRTLEDYKPLVADQPPVFEPGTRWSYSNTGMLLLGVIIQEVAGVSYFDYVRKHIFEPAGMADTDAYDKDEPTLNRATGYYRAATGNGLAWRSNLTSRVVKGGPSGGSYSTVEDLLRFDVALRTHKLLSPELLDIVLSPKPEISSPFYGYGFFVGREAIGRTAGHGGDGMGISSQFKMYLDAGYTVAVLSNYSPPAAGIAEMVCHGLVASSQTAVGLR